MPVTIRAVETAVPPTALPQSAMRDLLAAQPDVSRLGRRLIQASFDASAIETRHTVLAELAAATEGAAAEDGAGLICDPGAGRILSPGTKARNDVYIREAPALFSRAAKQALAAVPELLPDDVSHVVTVSCTGFFSPGPDHLLVRELGLRPTVQRYHLGFMGCYGAFPALRLARATCQADPDAVVLIVCAELCSLHLQVADDPDTIVSSSVFADGAAAALVTARPLSGPGLAVEAMASVLTAAGETDMTWTIGDQGFDMVLTGAVPRLIESEVESALAPLFTGVSAAPAAAIRHWAVHPGGRSVLDRVQRALALSDAQLAPSREVLRRYGNMSSATVWFILATLLQGEDGVGPVDERVCALAFGPGLTVESALLRRVRS